jgi:hypothetical protein
LAIIGTLVLAILRAAQAAAPGGFLEPAASTATRPPVVPALPARGKFTFPAPYNTVGVRLTNASDCNGSDCLNYVGYSYWRNTNNHVGSDTMLIFFTLDRSRGAPDRHSSATRRAPIRCPSWGLSSRCPTL